MTPLLLAAALLATGVPQTDEDEYTRYELLAPDSARFLITYEVTATTPGARFYFNPIRKGSVATDEAVRDRSSGRRLAFEIVTGAQARTGGHPEADLETRYIKVTLPRPVPSEGEVRLLIEKTYQDPKSYFLKDGRIVFTRTLGIRRNSVVLPAGYELVRCNVPSQVWRGADGRIAISFMNPFPTEAALVLEGRRLP